MPGGTVVLPQTSLRINPDQTADPLTQRPVCPAVLTVRLGEYLLVQFHLDIDQVALIMLSSRSLQLVYI